MKHRLITVSEKTYTQLGTVRERIGTKSWEDTVSALLEEPSHPGYCGATLTPDDQLRHDCLDNLPGHTGRHQCRCGVQW